MKIKKIRMAQGMTQSELAEKLGVSRSTVAMWETGANVPNADKLPSVAKALACKSIDELFEQNENHETNGAHKDNP